METLEISTSLIGYANQSYHIDPSSFSQFENDVTIRMIKYVPTTIQVRDSTSTPIQLSGFVMNVDGAAHECNANGQCVYTPT